MNPQQAKAPEDLTWAYLTLAILFGLPLYMWIGSISTITKLIAIICLFVVCFTLGIIWFAYFSKYAKDKQQRREVYDEIPEILRSPQKGSVVLGKDCDLTVPIYFPDSIRSRHVHILGSTGSGKTESVILNLLKQDIALGRGAIILDAKGDDSFQKHLKKWLPEDRLHIRSL
ncbi:MAG: type IV secretion system DNA-binding domain-containing protein [Bdellovibrionota bacterium]